MMLPAEIKQELGYGAQSEIACYLGVSVAHVFYVIGYQDKRKQLVRREDANVQREIAARLGLSVKQVFGDERVPLAPGKKRTRRAGAK